MQAREGELIKTKNNVVFDVKGLLHPPDRIVAFPRFIPSKKGKRRSADDRYGKIYHLNERFQFLRQNMPQLIVKDPVFDETLCEVPTEQISKHYKPIEKLRELESTERLTELEEKAVNFAQDLKKAADIPDNAIGISGSVLVGLSTLESDIDPVVYGVENSRKAYSALESLLKDEQSRFKPYNREELQTLFDFRSKDTQMSFEDFVTVESRKAFQGKFMKTDYFVRFVKNWTEIHEKYGDTCYKNCGCTKIKATIQDDSEALFTPCTYTLENVEIIEGTRTEPIEEIVSFRGRFCQQAKNGETVLAQGKIEQVLNKKKNREYYRLILGNTPSDFMALSRV